MELLGAPVGRKLRILVALVPVAALVAAGCGSTEVPKGDTKPPSERKGVPEPPSAGPK